MFIKTVLLGVVLYSGFVCGWTTVMTTSTTSSATTMTPKSTAAGCWLSCPSCPSGYSPYQMNYHGQCRCLCEYTGNYYQTSTQQHVGRGVLMQLLRNLQTNAAALEQMASGVSDEANIAESVANISK